MEGEREEGHRYAYRKTRILSHRRCAIPRNGSVCSDGIFKEGKRKGERMRRGREKGTRVLHAIGVKQAKYFDEINEGIFFDSLLFLFRGFPGKIDNNRNIYCYIIIHNENTD